MDPANWTNAGLLRLLRKKLGWSQPDLAHAADVSVRVVAKAESGEGVSPRTIRALVRAFREEGQEVDAADLTCNPESLARQFLRNYAIHQAECVAASKEFLSPEIVAYLDGDPETNPIAGTYHGLDEFEALWRKFFALFIRDGGTLADDPQLRCNGNEIVAWGHERIRVRDVPPQPAGFVMLRMQFQHGLMVRFEDYYESTGMMRALEQWATEYPDADWVQVLNHTLITKAG